MVELFAQGRRLGSWAEAEAHFIQPLRQGAVEFRDEAGALLACAVPPSPPAHQVAQVLAAIAALPEEPGDASVTGDHDRGLYGPRVEAP
ncbi:MAG TPA: hypothetical protein PKD86_09215 [Gemmatales bacterium]|nr:hypothetical protein [Gemmatales bacterium]